MKSMTDASAANTKYADMFGKMKRDMEKAAQPKERAKRAEIKHFGTGEEIIFAVMYSTVHKASMYGDAAMIKDFHKQDKDLLDVADFRGDTPLHIAIKNKREPSARQLLELGAKVNKRNKMGISPLHLAVQENDIKLTKLLLSHNANPLVTDIAGSGCAHFCAQFDCLESLKLVLKKVGDDAKEKMKSDEERALSHGVAEKEFVESTGKSGLQAIHMAAISGSLRVLRFLVEVMKVNIDAQDSYGETPSFKAAVALRSESTALLKELGANFQIQTHLDDTTIDAIKDTRRH